MLRAKRSTAFVVRLSIHDDIIGDRTNQGATANKGVQKNGIPNSAKETIKTSPRPGGNSHKNIFIFRTPPSRALATIADVLARNVISEAPHKGGWFVLLMPGPIARSSPLD